jgi:NAD(P)-dependent dehydrogenase (short-subunit alcohol dehydrogenase family)
VDYPASKTAVNMITVQYAKAFPNMRINAVEPGFTKTDLNLNTGRQSRAGRGEHRAHGAGGP